MTQTTDGRILRGEATRRAILRHAADIASVEGLEGLSIGRLATELGVSKSGVFAHFGSKEELQLATIAAAREIYVDTIVTPAREDSGPGLARLRSLWEHWLDYAERRIFPGGCFFIQTVAEFDSRPGRIRDALREARTDWMALIERSIVKAQQLGELDPHLNAAQLAFELDAYGRAAASDAALYEDQAAIARARTALRDRLDALSTSAVS
jgi:AcrR family transcriptional regulator